MKDYNIRRFEMVYNFYEKEWYLFNLCVFFELLCSTFLGAGCALMGYYMIQNQVLSRWGAFALLVFFSIFIYFATKRKKIIETVMRREIKRQMENV